MNNKLNSNALRLLASILAVIYLTSCANEIVKNDQRIAQQYDLIDFDQDGVIKARDKCDETVIGAAIDNYGCGGKTSTIDPFTLDIKFANNSSTIPNSAYAKIKELAEFLEKYPTLNVMVEGHTSKVGSVELNQTLSENRASAIAFVLVNDFNISDKRVSSIGYGFERLLDDGETEFANSTNRRIMADITSSGQIDVMKWTIYSVDDEL